ncbi:MAG: hypothetical protein AB8B72_10070 [Crocinitomicaceae bacterium]
MEVLDGVLNDKNKEGNTVSLMFLGILAYMSITSIVYLLTMITRDIAIISGLTYIPTFVINSILSIVLTYATIDFWFKSANKYLSKIKTTIMYTLYIYIAVQVVQFIYVFIIYNILPTVHFENSVKYSESRPYSTLFVLLETVVDYSSIILLYVLYKKHIKSDNL